MVLIEKRYGWAYAGYDYRRLFGVNVELWTTSVDLDVALLGFWFSGSFGAWGYGGGDE
ncbi:hypothetical protein LCGC14_2515190 [marine sediment metagenome]|uniref:Uncharacterized protein n=1 Tax=marine sediment metagenome TaxID=412755 RepID=A0A0F9AYH9_9ZZZZ